MKPMKTMTGVLALSLVLLGAIDSRAEDAPKDAKEAAVKPLLSQDLPDVAGKEVEMLTVEYPPGGSSKPHRHNADVFVYVLSGSVVMQVDGQEAVTLGAGQTFHERPTDVHRVSANASKTTPAKFVVFIVKDKGKATTQPVS
ncbi:MAG TPA: cupin domain-containing protein [Steroidobacteraceae bacterium]|jgi:quercetin dioxygenase-like cupin family protein|nr:cupin domain-containing protein [Steroidobacteraceae bacterium]